MNLNRRALIALAIATAQSVAAADNAMATAHWELGFGGTAMTTAFSLALGLRTAEHFGPAGHMVEFHVNERQSIATIAGLPIAAHTFQAAQSGDEAYEAGVAQKPFYARPWFLWTMAGLAGTAALLGTASSDGSEGEGQGPTDPNSCVGPDATDPSNIDTDCISGP